MRCITSGPYAAHKPWGQLLQASQYKFALKKERKTKVRNDFDLGKQACHFTAAPLQRLPGMGAADLLQKCCLIP